MQEQTTPKSQGLKVSYPHCIYIVYPFILGPSLKDQPNLGYSFGWQKEQVSWEKLTMTLASFAWRQHTSGSLTFHWPKNITWPSPKSWEWRCLIIFQGKEKYIIANLISWYFTCIFTRAWSTVPLISLLFEVRNKFWSLLYLSYLSYIWDTEIFRDFKIL